MSEYEEQSEDPKELEKERSLALHAVMSFLAVLILFGIAVGVVAALIATAPQAKKKDAEATVVPAVTVAEVEPVERGARIQAEGVIESQKVVTLTAEVSGKLVEVSPNLVAGGQVRKDEVLARIEPADYQAALEQAKSAVADAVLAVEQELARRDQALRDWEKLGRGEASDLLRRKPQVASAKARLESAKAELARARRNVERTILRAPFDGVVRSENVEVGAYLAPGAQVATLFSASELEVVLPVKLEDYALLKRDEMGQPTGRAMLTGTLGNREVTWPADIVRSTGEVERGALTAGIVAEVEPAEAEGELTLPPPGMFVEAELEGQPLEGMVRIPRDAVREGEEVAVVREDGTLSVRKVKIVRGSRDEVFASEGVEAGERVVLTRLSNAKEGVRVVIEGDETNQEED